MDAELERQFELMDRHLRPEAEVHTAVIQFTKLMRMHYEYMKKVSILTSAKVSDERTGCF